MTAGSEIPAGSVVITPQDMWDSIGRIETGMNDIKNTIAPQVVDLRADHSALSDRVDKNKDDTDKSIGDHETRIRALEKANWRLIGVYSAVTVAVGLAETYFTTHH